MAVLGIAAAAAVAVAFVSSPLPRITPDAAVYLTGAEALAEAGEFVNCEREITEYAPGYPATLAVFVFSGLDAPDSARIVNVLATLVLVLGAGLLARAAGLGRTATTLVALVTAVAPVTLRNGAAAWSEQTFCALLVVLLLATVNGGRGLEVRLSGRLALVLALSWALLLTRYSGLFALPAIVLAAWIGSRALPKRVLRVAAFTLGLAAVPTLWYARNIDAGTGPFGSRSGSDASLSEVLRQVPDGLSSIVVPVDGPLLLRLAVLVPLLLAAALALRPVRVIPAILGTLVVAYVAGVTYAATRTRLDPVDARLLSPVFVPGAVLVALGVTRWRAAASGFPRALRASVVAIVVGMTVLTPGIAWYLHDAERELVLDFPVSCAEWPARYPGLTQPEP